MYFDILHQYMDVPVCTHDWLAYNPSGIVRMEGDQGFVWFVVAKCLIEGCNILKLERGGQAFIVDGTILKEPEEGGLRYFLPRGKEEEIRPL